MSEEKLPFTENKEYVDCSANNCNRGRARYFIDCKNNWTGSTYLGHVCDKCLPKAIEDSYKITGYIVYPEAIEQFLTPRKTNADYGNPSGVWDMKGMLEELEEIAK